jgi:hypothetical protein
VEDKTSKTSETAEELRKMVQEDRFNDARWYDVLPPEEQAALQTWIRLAVAPASRSDGRTSYGIKHDFETVGFYVPNGAFKGAMLAAGYEPTPGSKAAKNWQFRIRPRSRAFVRKRKNTMSEGIGRRLDGGRSFYGLWHLTEEEVAPLLLEIEAAKRAWTTARRTGAFCAFEETP